MELAILLFDGLTPLDAVGPWEVLCRLPGLHPRFVAREPGPKRSARGDLVLVAEHGLAELPSPELVLVPGGPDVDAVMEDEAVLDWLRGAHATSRFTTSVCTGSLVLGAAGLLRDLPASTHWNARERLRELGARPTEARLVEAGRIVTAAGVSAGIDMALHLAARLADREVARAIQLSIEYDPEPPFDAGSPAKAGPRTVELVQRAARRR